MSEIDSKIEYLLADNQLKVVNTTKKEVVYSLEQIREKIADAVGRMTAVFGDYEYFTSLEEQALKLGAVEVEEVVEEISDPAGNIEPEQDPEIEETPETPAEENSPQENEINPNEITE